MVVPNGTVPFVTLVPRPGPNPFLFLVRHSEHGGPPGPRSRSKHSLAPIRLYLRNNFGGLRADGANGLSVGAKGYFHSRVTGTDGKNACVIA